jgi:hydroxymethylbilane synthase
MRLTKGGQAFSAQRTMVGHMHVRLLSRSSALAVLQATLVERALTTRWPDITVERLTRSSQGDRDPQVDLWAAADKGLFTSDLSQALVDDAAEAVVHSWKDLPTAGYPGTVVAATLERADPRDVLLVRRATISTRPTTLNVLSSSPRRAWQIQGSAPRLLPWPITDVRVAPVRGNVPTRLNKLVSGDGDALIVAKAALDRLLSNDSAPETTAAAGTALGKWRWTVLPLKEHPTAPAQGALAIEIATGRTDLLDRMREISHGPTWEAVGRERSILESFGGGCHEAVGATVVVRDYGRIVSVRARVGDVRSETWALETSGELPPRTSARAIWPRPDERGAGIRRRAVRVAMPADDVGFWIARAEALPADWDVTAGRIVWTAGLRTWERLASRGVWVNGCADGLGDNERPDVDELAGRPVTWRRLTHTESGDPEALATYAVEETLPDFGGRTHFFWTSGSAFARALVQQPTIRTAWHASGPGRTARAIRDTLGADARLSLWLDYEQWHTHVTS